LNSWLLDKCVAYAKVHKHPEISDRTVWRIFEDERGALVQVPGRFDGFHATTASVSNLCGSTPTKYSVSSRAVGRPFEVQAYADRIIIRQHGVVVAARALFWPQPRRLNPPARPRRSPLPAKPMRRRR
jgi:hypothetical protein